MQNDRNSGKKEEKIKIEKNRAKKRKETKKKREYL